MPSLLHEFSPSRLLPSVTAGLINGVLNIFVAIAFAGLIYSGDLSPHRLTAIGTMLIGVIIFTALSAFTSAFPNVISSIQDSPAAILAVMAAAIATDKAASSDELFLTIVATVGAASVLTGITFLILGQLKLGNLIRFIPYPVIGGFLAGTGMLLTTGALSFMTGESVTLTTLFDLLDSELVNQWLPGLIFALILLVILRRYSHFLILHGMLIGVFVGFYVILALTGTSKAEASDQGWLLDVLPEGDQQLWQPITPSDLKLVDWSEVAGQSSNLLAIAAVSAIALLLNATGLELVTGRDVDLNRELKSVGLSNLMAGLIGSPVGFHALGGTALAQKMGARSRLTGLTIALLAALVVFLGAGLLAYFPNFVLGGLLLFLGLSMLVEWVYDAWFKLARIDYGTVIVIMLTITAVGFLEGVGLGLVLTVLFFVINYSRINVVKHALSGANYQSNVVRSPLDAQMLHDNGSALHILKLQGFIFFGTAHRLLDQIRQRVNDPAQACPRFVLLDFRLVSGLDSSAVLGFTKLKNLAESNQIRLLFTALSPTIQHQLTPDVLPPDSDCLFPDLDHGVEWCEEQILASQKSQDSDLTFQTLKYQIEQALADPGRVSRLMSYLEQQTVETGAYLVKQNAPPQGFIFIESGEVTIYLERANGTSVRIRKMRAGTLVGEMGAYLSQPASASVIADQPSIIYRLSLANLHRMEQDNPDVASAFHRFMARFMAERLTQTTTTLQRLID